MAAPPDYELDQLARFLRWPGMFLTDISKAWDLDAFADRADRQIPLQRGGQPDEIVGAALYLASAASSYTNGAIIKIDGGLAHAPA